MHIKRGYMAVIHPTILKGMLLTNKWGTTKSTFDHHNTCKYRFWLVVYLPLWKIWKSVGMMTFPTSGKIKKMFQTTRPDRKNKTPAIRANLSHAQLETGLFQGFHVTLHKWVHASRYYTFKNQHSDLHQERRMQKLWKRECSRIRSSLRSPSVENGWQLNPADIRAACSLRRHTSATTWLSPMSSRTVLALASVATVVLTQRPRHRVPHLPSHSKHRSSEKSGPKTAPHDEAP